MTNYIGNTPGLSQRLVWRFVATSGQTVITGTDENNLTLNFSNYEIDVFVNGNLLTKTEDYTTTGTTTITISSALSENDEIIIIGVALYNLADHYTKVESDVLLAGKTSPGKSIALALVFG